MASIYSLESSKTITVDGKVMKLTDYKKLMRQRSKKTKKTTAVTKKKHETEITVLPNEVKNLMKKNAKLVKSLSAYYNNGYRQWGTVAKNIINLKGISTPFTKVNNLSIELNQIFDDINRIAKGNEKAAYQYVLKYSWKLDDLRTSMDELYNGVTESGVLQQFGDRECINGEGRRLGLLTLMRRVSKSIGEFEESIQEIKELGVGHMDAMEYGINKYEGIYRTNR